jgi:hypothetical protein
MHRQYTLLMCYIIIISDQESMLYLDVPQYHVYNNGIMTRPVLTSRPSFEQLKSSVLDKEYILNDEAEGDQNKLHARDRWVVS